MDSEIVIECRDLTKVQINKEIANRTRGLIDVHLLIGNYKYSNFTDFKLDSNSIVEFNCFFNEITSFAGLRLPNSLKEFECSHNHITSFDKLVLPDSLLKFDCSFNKITSFSGLALPPSLIRFICSSNQVTRVQDFVFPRNLEHVLLDKNIKFVNPKFNSVMIYKLENEVEFDILRYNDDELIFLYLNFRMVYQQYELLITKFLSE